MAETTSPDGAAAAETLPHKQSTELERKQSSFQDAAYSAASSSEEENFSFLQWAAERLADATADPEEKAQARKLNRLLKRLIRGFRVNRPSIGLPQSDAEQVQDLTLALVWRILSQSIDPWEKGGYTTGEYTMGTVAVDFPFDFLIDVTYLCDTAESDDNSALTPEQQQVRLAFLDVGPRLVELAYLASGSILAEEEPDLPPYRIGEDWYRIRTQIEQIANLRPSGKERALAQSLLFVLDDWQRRGEATEGVQDAVALDVKFLMGGIAPDSHIQLPPIPPGKDEWFWRRPFSDEENARYRQADAIEQAYKKEVWESRGRPLPPTPEELRMSELERHRFHRWKQQQEGQFGWAGIRDDFARAWQELHERKRYWDKVRERHRQTLRLEAG